jgi:hypothetical protein
MAGGYGRDMAVTVDVHLNTLRAALDSWQRQPARASSTMEESGA